MHATVLIIENDPSTLEVMEYVVKELNVDIVTKTDAIPLDELEKLNPALVLLDHWLDNGYGAEYCKQIKANEPTKHIPVVIVSFIAGLQSIAEESDADDCVTKPFNVEQLQEIIHGYLV